MTLHYEHLLGLEFKHGSRDCLELLIDFYRDNYQIEITPYARPDGWWDNGMNLYMEHMVEEGFEPVQITFPLDMHPGDVFLMAIRSKVGNHVGIYLGEGKFIHHFYGRRSNVEVYKGIWRNTTITVGRHQKLKYWEPEEKIYDLAQDPRVARNLA